jgi:hypothetical protein
MNTSLNRNAKVQTRTRRAIRVQVRTDKVEYGAWCAEADRAGKCFAEWARDRLNGAPRAADRSEQRELVRLRELVVYTLQIQRELRRHLQGANAPALAQALGYLEVEWSRRVLAGSCMEADSKPPLAT